MPKKPTSQSGIFNPRISVACALCSLGVLLGVFSLAATPPADTTRANTSVPPDRANFLSTSVSHVNRLPPGVPLPPGAQFSPKGQGDTLNNTASNTRGVHPGFAGMSLRPGTTSGANSLANPGFANQQPAPLRMPRPPASESMPLAPGAASNWSVVNSPNTPPVPTPNNQAGVTCISMSNCWAVGYYYNGSVNQTLIEHWDGTSWAIVNSPNTSITRDNFLVGVTCTSASDCWAVGYYLASSALQNLVMHWDGTAWSIVSAPSTSPTQRNLLLGVTCASASNCWAVGSYFNGGAYQTLIERWDGTSWSVVSSPNTSPTQDNILAGVTCASGSDCWSVGYHLAGVAYQTLIEHWDGTAWAIVASPNASLTQGNTLAAVTCTSASDCWAVGAYFNGVAYQTLIERWDGASWAIVSSPNSFITQRNALAAVTCVSASNCWAVGAYFNGSVDQTLIERWDGTAWSIVSSPNTLITQDNALTAVTCTAASDCWAVGYHFNGSISQTLVERWDGTSWSIVTSPSSLITQHNRLLGVTCASASDCWAVGYHFDGSVNQTLIEHWDGNSWAIVPSPNPLIPQSNRLAAVTCVSASDCWAVGFSFDGTVNQTLIVHWDGNSWAIVPSPNTSITQSNTLAAVTCAAAANCWAVGYYSNGSANQTLTQHWDGTSWTIVDSPNTSITQQNALAGVACESASNCWAIGSYLVGVAYQTLIERWDGTSWTIVASPNNNTRTNLLQGITCASASDCWAVGYYSNGSVNQTLIERWDGTSWAIVASPSTSATQSNFLVGVTCESASNCWTIGFSLTASSVVQTLIERWDGTSWAIVSSPNTSATQNNLLFAVTCASASDCWAVGYYVNASGSNQTLAEHYTASSPLTPTSVVSRKIHGSTETFDIALLLAGNPDIECRTGGTSGDHTLVFSFANPLTSVGSASVTSGTGMVSSSAVDSSDARNYIVNLTDVTNAQTITISLANVSDSAGNTSASVSASMAVLLGDVNANGRVSNADVGDVKAAVGSTVSESTFRNDVNANGTISNGDVGDTKAQVGSTLP